MQLCSVGHFWYIVPWELLLPAAVSVINHSNMFYITRESMHYTSNALFLFVQVCHIYQWDLKENTKCTCNITLHINQSKTALMPTLASWGVISYTPGMVQPVWGSLFTSCRPGMIPPACRSLVTSCRPGMIPPVWWSLFTSCKPGMIPPVWWSLVTCNRSGMLRSGVVLSNEGVQFFWLHTPYTLMYMYTQITIPLCHSYQDLRVISISIILVDVWYVPLSTAHAMMSYSGTIYNGLLI